jgi:hypothetical protein
LCVHVDYDSVGAALVGAALSDACGLVIFEELSGQDVIGRSTSDSLSDDEKRQVVVRFRDLQHAIATNAADLHASYEAFSQVYQGDSRAFVDAFPLCRTSADRDRWVTQLNAYLYDEIGPQFWRSRR